LAGGRLTSGGDARQEQEEFALVSPYGNVVALLGVAARRSRPVMFRRE